MATEYLPPVPEPRDAPGGFTWRHLLLVLVAVAAAAPFVDFTAFAPPGEELSVVVYESEQPLSSELWAAVDRLREAGHEVRVVDQNSVTGGDGVPAEIAPHLAEARGKSLPWLVVTRGERVVRSEAASPAALEEVGR